MVDFIDDIYKKIGDSDFNQDVSGWLSTGLLPLNKAIAGKFVGGGFPIGRITEVFGAESAGKTLLATMALIETQRLGGIAVFLDHEHAFSLSRGISLGLDADRSHWIYKQPQTAEESFSIIETIGSAVRKADSTKPVTIVIDSIASMMAKAEFDTDFGEDNMKTRLALSVAMSTGLKKIAPIVSKTNVTLIFLNQLRDNPGIMFGDKESTPGGRAMKFYASVRVKLSKRGKEKDGDEIVGERVKAIVVKNKVFEPWREADHITSFKTGVNLALTHIEFLKEMGKLGDAKGWLEFCGKKYRQKELVDQCNANPDAYKALVSAIAEMEK